MVGILDGQSSVFHMGILDGQFSVPQCSIGFRESSPRVMVVNFIHKTM